MVSNINPSNLQELNGSQKDNLFRILEESDIRSLRSIPVHLYNLNFQYDKSKITFDKCLTPLLVACFIGKLEVIQILFSNELIDINMGSENEGYTPLMVALYKGYYEITKYLLDNNADVNKITKSGHYPILFCFSRLEDDKYKYENRTLCILMIDLMLSKGADINIRVDSNPGHNVLMKLLNADINDEESYQSTISIVKYLLERGADKNMTTLDGITLVETIKSDLYRERIVSFINSVDQIYFYNVNKEKEKEKSDVVKDKDKIVKMDRNLVNENCCSLL